MSANMKKLSLIGTVWFHVSQNLAIRWFNIEGHRLDANFMALATEICKVFIVCILCRGWLHKTPFPGPIRWGFMVNALLYIGTNILTYVILESIDAGLYMVLIQHRILLVVFLSTVVFKRSYSRIQWFACLLLMFGIMLAEYKKTFTDSEHDTKFSAVLLILAQGLCSSFSGVWIEKMMKRQSIQSGKKAPEPQKEEEQLSFIEKEKHGGILAEIMADNTFYDFLTDSCQMYLMSVPFYGLLTLTSTGTHTLPVVPSLALVVNGACVGLFIGSIFKYSSATVRSFVQGAVVIVAVWLSAAFLHETLTMELALGTVCVVGGILLFNRG